MDIKCPYCKTEYEIEQSENCKTVKCQICGKEFAVTAITDVTEGKDESVSEKVKDAAKAVAHVAYEKVRKIDWERQGERVKAAATTVGLMAKKLNKQSDETGLKYKTRLAIIGVLLEVFASGSFLLWISSWFDLYFYFSPKVWIVCAGVLSLFGWIVILQFFIALYKRQ